jgi:NADPH:quinone reductase-like Zn-dependent oxidoreductase
MKGVIFEQFGPPENLKIRNDLPKPERKPGQGLCLVQIASTSVNPIDYKTRKGEMPRFMVKLPNVRNYLCPSSPWSLPLGQPYKAYFDRNLSWKL